MSTVTSLGNMVRDRATEARDDALFIACTGFARKTSDAARRIELLMAYLETFPTGAHNREVAEEIERTLDRLVGHVGSTLMARYRALRDEYLPPLNRVSLPIPRDAGRAAARS